MTKKHKVVVDVKNSKIGCSECNLWENIPENEKPFGRPMKWLSKHTEELQVSYEEAHVEEIEQLIRDDLIKELKEQHNEQMTDVLYSEFGEDL